MATEFLDEAEEGVEEGVEFVKKNSRKLTATATGALTTAALGATTGIVGVGCAAGAPEDAEVLAECGKAVIGLATLTGASALGTYEAYRKTKG
jgi:hypothetical protein